MIVVPALVLLAGAAVVAVVLVGASVRADDGAGRVVVAIGGVVGLVVVLGLVVGVGVGVDSGDDTSEVEPAVPPAATVPSDLVQLRAPTIELRATSADRLPSTPAVVGDVQDGAVVVLGMSGLGSGSRATVHQCRAGAARATECRPGLPVVVGEHERAVALVDLQERFDVGADERVDCREVDCSIVVFGTARLEAVTTFGRPAAAPVTVVVEPRVLAPGATVTATAAHLPPGAQASFTVCRPGDRGVADCGPGTSSVLVDADGAATATVAVAPGRCPRGATCAVAVTVDDGGPRAYAHLELIGRAGATYEERRVRIGLLVAAALAVIALVLLRRTDWTPVEGDPFADVQLPDDPFAGVEDG